MNRTFLLLAGVLSVPGLLLVDSAVKGTALLLLAAVAAVILRRDSAATRHLVWLLALVALLAVPVLSAMLPEWQVLPAWASLAPATSAINTSPPSMASPAIVRDEMAPAKPDEVESPSATAPQSGTALPDARPASTAPPAIPPLAGGSWNWLNALPLGWALGFCVLILRLLAARWLLWTIERRRTVIGSSSQYANSTNDPIVAALQAARSQLGITRPVTLMIEPGQTIPVVWGVLRCYLLLPAAARNWTGDQLRSVLLHELAHVKRRDPLAQLMAQLACALHWFNPLVWFAAWRLGVERERACDDLVLASGVRPSAYAGHVLEVVAGLAPARWTQPCALAMARKSSLEGLLIAVLSGNLNRRRVSVALAAIALLIATGVAVPLAMLRATEEPWRRPQAVHFGSNEYDAFTIYGVHNGQAAAYVIAYKGYFGSSSDHRGNARTRTWNDNATLSLETPAGQRNISFHRDHTAPDKLTLAGTVYDLMQGRVFLLNSDGAVRQLAISPPAIQERADADALATQIAAIPPQEREQATPKPNDAVKLPGRLFVNAGLRTTKDEKRFSQSAIAIDPNTGNWTRLLNFSESGFTVPLSPVRVSPDGRTMLFLREKALWKCDAMTGDRTELLLEQGTPSAWSPDGQTFIAVVETNDGDRQLVENWIVTAAGQKQSVLALPKGDAVEDWSADGQWLAVRSRLDSQIYLVKPDGSGRRRLAASIEYIMGRTTFSPDSRRIVYVSRQVLDDTNRFSLRAIHVDGTGGREILGETKAGPQPDSANWTAPMAARWSPDGKRLAVVLFDHARDGGILAINGNWRLAIIDDDGGNLRELKLEGVLNTVLPWDGPEWRPMAPAEAAREPKVGAKLRPATEQKLKWGQPANGLRMALAWPPSLGEPGLGDAAEFQLVVQNVSEVAVRLTVNAAAPNKRRLLMRDNGSPLMAIGDDEPTPGDWRLQPREVVFLRMFGPAERLRDGGTLSAVQEQTTRKYPHYSLTADMTIEQAPAGAWTGKLATGETRGSVDVLPPQHKDAQALYKTWTAVARADGKIPGGVIALLGESVRTFIKNNPTWETTPRLLKMLPRFDASRDWSGQDAVALLDELAAVQATPINMALDNEYEGTIKSGTPLPQELVNAPWGDAHPSGLRLAYLLEPRGAEHRLGTPLKGRILIHNVGQQPVVFRAWTWHQAEHAAQNAKGAAVKLTSTHWTTLGRLVPFRLAPGDFAEINTAGIGVGANKNSEDWHNTRVGSWVEAREGDEVTVTTAPVPLSDRNEEPPLDGEPRWWLDFITARLSRHLPFPADAEARELVLYRVAMELFGTPVGEEINAAFVADRGPTALDALAQRLVHRAGLTTFSGPLTSGSTSFRVLPADPDAAKRPRVASSPGRYTLGENIRLIVTRRPVGERIVNEATIQFFSPDPKANPPGKPVALKLPDGYDTWAAAWVRDAMVLWVQEQSGIRSYDFSNPAQVKEQVAELKTVPLEIRKSLYNAVSVPEPKRVGKGGATAPLPPASTRP